jgi:hypothetical protein
MKNYDNGCAWLKSCIRMMSVGLMLAASAHAAQFQFGALIQAGVAGAGDWEIGVGDSSGGTTVTSSLGSHWVNGVDRAIQMEYSKTTNTISVRVYNGATATGGFTEASFQPTGGAAMVADAIWTLPAASFFATAEGFGAGGPVFASSITISNLTLSGVSGAINVIEPIQQTTLVASRAFLGGTSTVSQSQDIVFQADSTGSWRLQGTIQMTGLSGAGASGNDLSLQFNALASDVPEPGTLGLMGLGCLALFGLSRRKSRRA